MSRSGKENYEVFITSAVCSALAKHTHRKMQIGGTYANVLKAAMRMYLNHRRQKAQKTHGKTSVKKLVGEGVGVSSIEVTDGNIKSFERVARKYNVDFAVKKDKTTAPPKYVVFFKGRDADAVAQAFKEFVYGNEKRKSRTSVREKLKRFRDAVSQNKNRERSREKNKDRGQSL